MIYKSFFTVLILLSSNLIFSQTVEEISSKLAEDQLVAYNNRDIEAFLLPYSDSVKIFRFPNVLQYQGKETMRKQYGKMFEDLPDLHCELVNRMMMGNTVIDQESVVFRKDQPKVHAIAIYKIRNNKIQEVYFISKD
jgi:hypothetical protein